ncbi:uncharacterized protein LOC133737440 [Rosa rugosa]|uniref:uncharacterized protein LOC133737440 n=1 Tax=Rosa rugosa TaxID=74645 RepID=UPI002B40525E|nr:uncharacterized protein LOC133737440 [Rosa rugosa]
MRLVYEQISEAEMIFGMPLGLRNVPDKLVWHFTKNGTYSVKSGYWVARDMMSRQHADRARSSTNGCKEVWEKIWGINAPHKIKVFMWRAVKGFLPCATNLKQKKILEDSRCWQCGWNNESVMHVLWDCLKVKKIWKKTFLQGVCRVWQEPTFLDLVHHICSTATRSELETFCFTAWWIWRNRNLHRYEEKSLEPEEVA